MEKPLVSIIVPVYNVEQYLEQCLTSIVEQTYENIEVIIVNDGSNDSSHLIIDQFAKKDPRVKFLKQKNSGISTARNSGIQASTGELILFVDSDDWVDNTLVEKLFSYIKKFDLVVCSYNRAYDYKLNPRILNIEGKVKSKEFQRRLVGLLNEELKDPSQQDSLVTAWGKLYKSKVIKENKLGFISTQEIGTCEDLIFNFQYLENCNEVFILNESLYFYRKANNLSFTSRYKLNLYSLWNNLFKKIEKLNIGKSIDFDLALNNRIALSIIGLGLNELQNPKGFMARYHNLKTILKSPLHKKAYHQLELKYFPLHWKIFFFFAKYRLVLGVYFMLIGIRFMVNRYN
jgi:glycosyltransferase EpsH